MDATNLTTAINEFRNRALAAFNAALKDVDSPPGNTVEQKALALAKAKGEMTAALQQLISADTMASDLRGREGYHALVRLMQNTTSAVTAVNTQIKKIAGRMGGGAADTPEQRARNEQIIALSTAMQALANMAPVDAWKKEE